MSFPSEISGMTISKLKVLLEFSKCGQHQYILKEELAAMKVDWIYHSKVNKPKLVALLHRLKKGENIFERKVVVLKKRDLVCYP